MCPARIKAALFRKALKNRPVADRFGMRDRRELGISEGERVKEKERERQRSGLTASHAAKIKMCVDAQRIEFHRYVRRGRLHTDVSTDPLAPPACVCECVGRWDQSLVRGANPLPANSPR